MTNLIKRNELNNFLSLDRAFNNLLKFSMFDGDDFFRSRWQPETDIVETDKELKLTLDCPGISLDDLKVTVENNILTIKGERKSESKEEKDSYYKLERSYGSFSRSFPLPIGIEEDSIKASYKDGVVSISATKVEQTKQRNIEIETTEEDKPKSLSASN